MSVVDACPFAKIFADEFTRWEIYHTAASNTFLVLSPLGSAHLLRIDANKENDLPIKIHIFYF